MTHSPKLGFSLAALAALGLASARPAAAVTLLTTGGTVTYGTGTSDILPSTFGKDGSIEFVTTASGDTAGVFKYRAPLFTNPNTLPGTTQISLPSYVSGVASPIAGVDQASGYGHPDIEPGVESGQVGYGGNDGSGDIFSFTVGAAKSFTFGVLTNYSNNLAANYSDNAAENPSILTLTESGSPASVPLSVSQSGDATAYATAYLFNIVNAAPGETFTLSTDKGYISGATFDSAASPAPEPSQVASLGFVGLGLFGLILKARKRALISA